MVGLRDRQRVRMRQRIQEQAMRLFLDRGFDAATVNDVAEAAEVSAMTVYRHFPSKESLVLADDYDPRIAALVQARPAAEPLSSRVLRGLAEGVAALGEEELGLMLARVRLVRGTPALRARYWETQYQTQHAIVAGLCGERADPEEEFRARVCVDACLAAAATAIFRWADEDGATDLSALLEGALAALLGESPRPDGRGELEERGG